MRDFKKYEVWQLGREFSLSIYSISKSFPKEEIYGITSQMRRAAISIPTNISEGCGRKSDKEFGHYINIASGSSLEIENLLILSGDLKFIENKKLDELINDINTIKKKLYHLHQKLIN